MRSLNCIIHLIFPMFFIFYITKAYINVSLTTIVGDIVGKSLEAQQTLYSDLERAEAANNPDDYLYSSFEEQHK